MRRECQPRCKGDKTYKRNSSKSWSLKCGPQTSSSFNLGALLEIDTLRPHSRLPESESAFYKIPRWFTCTLKFGWHCSKSVILNLGDIQWSLSELWKNTPWDSDFTGLCIRIFRTCPGDINVKPGLSITALNYSMQINVKHLNIALANLAQ